MHIIHFNKKEWNLNALNLKRKNPKFVEYYHHKSSESLRELENKNTIKRNSK